MRGGVGYSFWGFAFVYQAMANNWKNFTWKREDWPMPFFLRKPGMYKEEKAWRVEYSDDDPSKKISETPVPPDTNLYRRDGLYGAGAVEILMDMIINQNTLGYGEIDIHNKFTKS